MYLLSKGIFLHWWILDKLPTNPLFAHLSKELILQHKILYSDVFMSRRITMENLIIYFIGLLINKPKRVIVKWGVGGGSLNQNYIGPSAVSVIYTNLWHLRSRILPIITYNIFLTAFQRTNKYINKGLPITKCSHISERVGG